MDDDLASSSSTTAFPVMEEPWFEHLSLKYYFLLVGLPIFSFIGIFVLLRIIWKPKPKPKFKLPTKNVPTYGSTGMDSEVKQSSSTIEAGEVAGAYIADWRQTFDMVLLVGMILFFILLVILTFVFKPSLWKNGEFWLYMIPKLLTMVVVSLLGGIICRRFCVVDDLGYVMTTTNSVFKVNYTRKLQHFAAYLIPLALKPSDSCNCHGPLELAWGDLITLIGFLILIKPLRERFTFLMLQFNALDRPEDRPHTLKWIIAGNIAPGLLLLLFFRWIFSYTTQQNLVFIIVFITAIGDGLAEPVGIIFGRHKYETRSCVSSRKYTRSWEGSACVFLSGMVFPALQYKDFTNPTQLLLAMIILPPVIAYAEATAPHTMDTPVLMTLTGLILFGITHYSY